VNRLFPACAALSLIVPSFVAAPLNAQLRAITANERAQERQAHPELLQQFGGAYGERQDAYVAEVGRRIAVQSGLANSEREFTVTLLNSPVNNAFAIPGGYVYVTRQLLALMNDEAELAAVLGHEIGHVAARHSRARNRTSTVSSALAGILGVVTGNPSIGQIAGQAAQLYTLRFSRQQELQADDLGVRYLASAGYDPLAMSTALAALANQNALDQRSSGDARSNPEWASTHPDPASRVTRAAQRAQAGGRVDGARNRDQFLAAIDGMLYGDDPREGVINGQTFRHPGLRVAFSAPAGFALANSSKAVSITGPAGQAQFSTAPYRGNLPEYVQTVFESLGGGTSPAAQIRRASVNGLDAAFATVRASTGRQTVDATVFAYELTPSTAYHFVLVTRAGEGIGPFAPLVDSFHRMSANDAAQVRARVVNVLTVRPGDTPERLAQAMAYDDLRLERFLVLNGLRPGTPLRAGDKVKVVVWRR
jgi:predicted Zn-dependent protease